ncbi:MAG: phosphoribosylformylglycinamidine synthase subunit PurQ [Spirochaetes bacterium]|nr:MAG: phosphoribosylformylglycinamidine synthase subunit PurQ [Spirochaetota bacterium]
MQSVNTAIITGYGINADNELLEAFLRAGSSAVKVHIREFIDSPRLMSNFHIIAFPGGFSFGDHLGSGLVLAQLVKNHLKSSLDRFVASGKLIIGICNGFQVLTKMGFLPNLEGNWMQEVSLIHNDSGLFEDRWVKLKFNPKCSSPWISGLEEIELPIRNGEGRFLTKSKTVLEALHRLGLVALRYEDDINGSVDRIAGITDTTGQILGLMPHPEAFLIRENHPCWTRKRNNSKPEGEGIKIFKNGVEYIRKI